MKSVIEFIKRLWFVILIFATFFGLALAMYLS